MKANQKIMLGIIGRGQKSTEIRKDIPAEQLAFIITGALRLIVTKWRLSYFSFNLESEGKVLWQSINKVIKK